MTVLMQCLGCGTMVTNPRVMNMMYEMCKPCLEVQKEREELAIDSYLHQEAEKEMGLNA